jgi:hypothetical protein
MNVLKATHHLNNYNKISFDRDFGEKKAVQPGSQIRCYIGGETAIEC